MSWNITTAAVGAALFAGSIALEAVRAFDDTQNLPYSTVTIGIGIIGLTSLIASRFLKPCLPPFQGIFKGGG